jgi:uncharacterized membrane protein
MNAHYLVAAAVSLAVVAVALVISGIWLNRHHSLSYWESARRGGLILLIVALALAGGVLVATLAACTCL